MLSLSGLSPLPPIPHNTLQSALCNIKLKDKVWKIEGKYTLRENVKNYGTGRPNVEPTANK